MARLVTDVHVKDPHTRLMVHLQAGEEPAPEYAALVKNPDAWEGGKPPTAAQDAPDPDEGQDADTKQAAKKTAAKKPARGRTTAGEGTGGQ
ncbi:MULTISPECIES: hypothetical protein [Streptomyces]|uniref:hypothetical protein n=1 Tax=Streptomyces TaxID=1883 RepID=UPI0004CCF3FB|nr:MULTISPECIES: hypothetical protein [Streptomyces]